MKKSTFDLENNLKKEGFDFIIGVDEAGRGPLAGPVVAGAVIIKNYAIINHEKELKALDLVRDSKTLSHKQREKIFDFIHENFHVGVGICSQETVDRINILEASFLAMKMAVANLTKKITKTKNYQLKTVILVDGNKKIPNFSMEQKAIISGDKIVKSISAASIVAKVSRDRIMMEMHKKYPEYCFDKHKGYGTKLHMEMLQKHGPCRIHRKSFEPVRSLFLAKNKV